jgi:hypothetical protein
MGKTHQKNANDPTAQAPAMSPAVGPATASKMMLVTPVKAVPSSTNPA